MPTIIGTNGNDELFGDPGSDDLIDGLLGDDVLWGRSGNDRLLGSYGADTLRGEDGDDFLIGGAGDDVMIGGAGDDSYEITDAGDVVIEASGEGFDVVFTHVFSVTLGPNLESLRLYGSALGATGNELDNVLVGNRLNNTLIGGGGNDLLYGFGGDDVFEITEVGDRVVENANEGIDTVYSYVDHWLGNDVENLRLVGAATRGTGNDLDNFIAGNALDNYLLGGRGNDTLYGAGGRDILVGAQGDDIFYIDDSLDIVDGGEGFNQVFSSVDFYESGRSYGVSAIRLTATAVRAGGAPILVGNDGDNTLVAGTQMYGGLGNDSFEVRSSGAQVYEFAGEGTDTVFSHADDYTLSANVEILRLIGNYVSSAPQIGRGNNADNILYANQTGSLLLGGGGNDIMIGGAGNDRFRVTEAGDLVFEAAGQGTDTVDSYIDTYQMSLNVEVLSLLGQGRVGLGSAGDDTIIGNELGNVLNGNAGNDVLTGGTGADQFWHLAGGGLDRITDFDPAAGEFVVLSSSQFADYAAVQAAMTQSGSNVVITFSASQTLTLENVTVGQLSATNFGFHQGGSSAPLEGNEKLAEPLVMHPADDDAGVVMRAEPGVLEDPISTSSGEAEVDGSLHFGTSVSISEPQTLLPEAWPQPTLLDHLWL